MGWHCRPDDLYYLDNGEKKNHAIFRDILAEKPILPTANAVLDGKYDKVNADNEVKTPNYHRNEAVVMIRLLKQPVKMSCLLRELKIRITSSQKQYCLQKYHLN